jgi:hypothetical protein
MECNWGVKFDVVLPIIFPPYFCSLMSKRNPIFGKNRISQCFDIKEIRFFGKIGFLALEQK